MFTTIFTFVLLTYASAELPSYIHVCGRRDPKIEQCILESVNNLKSKICKGIPELEVPSNDPFIIKELAFSDTPEFKIYIRDSKITGFCDFKITNFSADIKFSADILHYDVDIIFDQIFINTTYYFDIRLLVPIASKGHLSITTDNVGAKLTFDFNVVTKGGKRYTYLPKIKIDLDIKKYDVQFDVENENLNQFQEIIHDFINQNQKEIIMILKPTIEEAVSKQVVSISNGIAAHFTYEELFPDRT